MTLAQAYNYLLKKPIERCVFWCGDSDFKAVLDEDLSMIWEKDKSPVTVTLAKNGGWMKSLYFGRKSNETNRKKEAQF